MFTLKNVTYKNILDIKDLNIKKSKVTCIVGESGCGKSTLLRLLNKLISCDSGDIFYDGQNFKNLDSIILRREVVMLPQVPSIFNGNIRDNLLIGLKFSEKPVVDDDRLIEILNLINLKKQLDDKCDTLSGGEKQRLALGRIILMDPKVFLLDEPSSSLDENTEKIIIKKLVEYTKKANKSLIMVTHSKQIALSYSDETIRVKNGRVIPIKEDLIHE